MCLLCERKTSDDDSEVEKILICFHWISVYNNVSFDYCLLHKKSVNVFIYPFSHSMLYHTHNICYTNIKLHHRQCNPKFPILFTKIKFNIPSLLLFFVYCFWFFPFPCLVFAQCLLLTYSLDLNERCVWVFVCVYVFVDLHPVYIVFVIVVVVLSFEIFIDFFLSNGLIVAQ